jgi:hypothetical protein
MNGKFLPMSLKVIVAVVLAVCAFSTARAEVSGGESLMPAAGNISINLVTPLEGAISDNDLAVTAIVTSTFQLNSVKAQVDGREISLTYSSTAICNGSACSAGWSGSLSLAGLTRGAKTLVVTATDVFGDSAVKQRPFTFDQPPQLTVTSPIAESVTGLTLRVKAECVDDNPAGCASISVYYQHPSFAPGTSGTVATLNQSNFDQDVTLPANIKELVTDGNMLILGVRGTDSANQTRTVTRIIYVQQNSRLIEVESFVGRILDVQGDRVLLLNNPGTAGNVLKIRTRSTGDESVIPLNGQVVTAGFLSTKGAVFSATDNGTVAPAGRVYESRDGALLDLGELFTDVKVTGDYALWDTFDRALSQPALPTRNLSSGITTQVAAETNAGGAADVAGNGDVVYTLATARDAQGRDLYNIYRYRSGTSSQLTNDAADFANGYPVTDGNNVVYQRQPRSPQSSDYMLSLIDSSNARTDLASQSRALSRGEYQAAGGWVAFPKISGGASQVWTRSPSGVTQQITFFGTNSLTNQLGANGEVVLTNGGRMYLQRAGDPLFDFAASSRLKAFTVGNEWYAFLGRTLFRLPLAVELAPVLLTDTQTGNAIVMSSVTHVRDPLPFASDANLTSDRRTRLLLFARNVDWLRVNPNAPLTVLAEDSSHRIFNLTVEHATVNPGMNWLTEIVVSLPDELSNGGDLKLTLNVAGFVSNRISVSITRAR